VQNPTVVGALGISLAPYMTAIAAPGRARRACGVLLAPIAGVHPRWAGNSHRGIRSSS